MGDHSIRPTVGGGARPSGVKRGITGKEIPTWTGTPEQVEFREKVLKVCIQAKLNKHKTRFSSLNADELRVVRGTKDIQVREGVEESVANFLEAAKQAFKIARSAAEMKHFGIHSSVEELQISGLQSPHNFLANASGEKKFKLMAPTVLSVSLERDVLLTVDIGITGYRSLEREEYLWRNYFPGYYNRTNDHRSRRFNDSHGNEAINFMVGFIATKKAPPGFSFHTKGIAIDFIQKRIIVKANGSTEEKWLTNSTKHDHDPGHLLWWYGTWLYNWLHANAASFGFKELDNKEAREPWHYDYIGNDSPN